MRQPYLRIDKVLKAKHSHSSNYKIIPRPADSQYVAVKYCRSCVWLMAISTLRSSLRRGRTTESVAVEFLDPCPESRAISTLAVGRFSCRQHAK